MSRYVYFSELAIGETFGCNGNIWTKATSRTAAGIWPAILPRRAYFGQRELCTRNPEALKRAD